MIKGLPEKLKLYRAQLALSQREVAKKLNVSPAIISSYETGERTPSTEKIIQLARLFRCSTDDLLLDKRCISPFSEISTEGLSRKQIDLLTELIDTMRKQ